MICFLCLFVLSLYPFIYSALQSAKVVSAERDIRLKSALWWPVVVLAVPDSIPDSVRLGFRQQLAERFMSVVSAVREARLNKQWTAQVETDQAT